MLQEPSYDMGIQCPRQLKQCQLAIAVHRMILTVLTKRQHSLC